MGRVTEYLDEKEQTPDEQPKASTPKPAPRVLGDTRLEQKAGKETSGKPVEMSKPKPAVGKAVEHFASF
jgi:hypothetical protein